MGSLIEKLQQARALVETKKMYVPEWDVDLYYKPLTTEEIDVTDTEAPSGAGATRRNLQLVILKALDADGKRLFSNDDAEALSSVAHPAVINRITSEMASAPTVEDAKKN
jgi:hypothetical protein